MQPYTYKVVCPFDDGGYTGAHFFFSRRDADAFLFRMATRLGALAQQAQLIRLR